MIAAFFAGALAAGLPAVAAPVAKIPEAQPIPRSIFVLPTSPKEGCDPFFPTSLRPYESAIPIASSGGHGDLTDLRLNGISGPLDHRLVIINDVTFAAGDEAEVRTTKGRIRIRCLEITGNTVVVEADGQRHELHYEDKP